jgi:hypothetical protein
MLDFVDQYKKIKVGSKIQVKVLYLMHGSRQVPLTFVEWAKRYRNVFTVDAIQEVDDSAMITVEEVKGAVEYDQIVPLKKSTRVLNWHREKKS